jgi:hypothetical protein
MVPLRLGLKFREVCTVTLETPWAKDHLLNYVSLGYAEMESALSNFRLSLQQSWTRRVIRTLTAERPPAALLHLTVEQISSIRDKEWESREAMYVSVSNACPVFERLTGLPNDRITYH